MKNWENNGTEKIALVTPMLDDIFIGRVRNVSTITSRRNTSSFSTTIGELIQFVLFHLGFI